MPLDLYRSDDMAMVTWLRIQGHTPQDVDWNGDTCYWTFLHNELLLQAVKEFMTGEARVDPKEYNKIFGKTKDEFYQSKRDQAAAKTR